MAYEFFLSYARANDYTPLNSDPYLTIFYKLLSQAIRDRRGLPDTVEVGFFDQRDLKLGDQWDAKLVEALQTSNVFIAIASPAYFKSEYCGKEWALFRQRLVHAANGETIAPLIKPLVWIPIKSILPT